MTIATAIGLFLIPVCYVFIMQIIERGRKNPQVPEAKDFSPKPLAKSLENNHL